MISVTVTGLDGLIRNFRKADITLQNELRKALGKGISYAEGEAKRRAPLDTGLLRSSIGGAQGYKFVRDLSAGVGTNVKYAFWVEVRDDVRHLTGQSHYMEKGAKASEGYIEEVMLDAMEAIADRLVK